MGRDERELDWRRYQQHEYVRPARDLAGYVARYWIVTWDYAEPYRQLIVPYPSVQLTFRDGGAEVHGVSSRFVVRELAGTGRVFGVEFRPGCFRPFLGTPVRGLTDRTVPAATIFHDLPREPGVPEVEAMLRANLPEPDPVARSVTELVDRIARDPSINRMDRLAAEAGLTPRQLQRLFAEYVGVGPKWVIRRYRLHEVTERMAARTRIDWAALAADLGYADQAHFARDFRRMVGESPTQYAERYGAPEY